MNRLYAILSDAIEELHPAYFALVMATGIVSIACQLQKITFVAKSLFYLNTGIYVVLCVLTIWRIFRFSQRFISDFTDHKLAPGFFTFTAGTGVLGSQYMIIGHNPNVGLALWLVTLISWFLLTYSIFTVLVVKKNKPSIVDGLHGGWLIPIVATQAVSVLGSLLIPYAESFQTGIIFISFIVWLFGGMLYIWIISMIFYRYIFHVFHPDDLTPPYWINMGAVAISTLAGANLIKAADNVDFLFQMLPFIKGFTFFFWSTATWWIPMLIILGFWRHVYEKFPLRYHPLYWGAVFPIGMYTVSTQRLAEAMHIESFLSAIPVVFVFIAIGAWLLTFFGMLTRFVVSFVHR